MFLCFTIEFAVLICCATIMMSSVKSMQGNRLGKKVVCGDAVLHC